MLTVTDLGEFYRITYCYDDSGRRWTSVDREKWLPPLSYAFLSDFMGICREELHNMESLKSTQ